MIQKAVDPRAGCRAWSSPNFWASSFHWKFFLTFFLKKFWKLKIQCKSFLKNVYMPEYWRHHILQIRNVFLQLSYSDINIQVRGTPKNFQGVERKQKDDPSSSPSAERQKQFTSAERGAPSAKRPFFGSNQFSSQIITTRSQKQNICFVFSWTWKYNFGYFCMFSAFLLTFCV